MNDDPLGDGSASWHERTCARYLAGAARQTEPVAFIVLGQPGAGQDAIVLAIAETLRGRGGAVTIDARELTLLHPDFLAIDPGADHAGPLGSITEAEVEGVATE